MAEDRIEVQRNVPVPASVIFEILSDPDGHVMIDSAGMLMSAEGDPVRAVGDRFTVFMDREALNDFPLGEYQVEVEIITFEQDREIAWKINSILEPPLGHTFGYRVEEGAGSDGRTLVTSYYDWSNIHPDWRAADIMPVISEAAIRATLGVLDRTARRRAAA